MAETDEDVDASTSLNFANSAVETAGQAVDAAQQSQEAEVSEEAGIAAQNEHHGDLLSRRRKRSSGKTAAETQVCPHFAVAYTMQLRYKAILDVITNKFPKFPLT